MSIVLAAWRSLREIDQAAACAKGSAFRAFRRIEPQLREGVDFRVLRAGQSEEVRRALQALRAQQRIYASSVSVILLSAAVAARLQAQLEGTR